MNQTTDVLIRKELSPKAASGLVRKSEFACCESGRRVTVQTRRFFLTVQSAAKASTESAAKIAPWTKAFYRVFFIIELSSGANFSPHQRENPHISFSLLEISLTVSEAHVLLIDTFA